MSSLTQKIIDGIQLGYRCSQIMMWMSMEMRGIDDPFVIRAMGALQNGMCAQRTCGTLTGAICVLSSYFSRAPGEREPTGYKELAQEFTTWFEKEYGSLDCRDLVGPEGQRMLQFCPGLMEQCFEKIIAILEEHGIDPTQ